MAAVDNNKLAKLDNVKVLFMREVRHLKVVTDFVEPTRERDVW